MSSVNAIIAKFHKFDEIRLAKVKELININNACQELLKVKYSKDDEDEHWESIYKFVFSVDVAHKARQLLNELGIEFSYYDPNLSSEADAIAFIDALDKVVSPMKEGLADQ